MRRFKVQGLSMIEVLVAMLVIMSSLAGYMQLFQTSADASYESLLRFRQRALVQELLEMLMANPSQRDTYQTALSGNGSDNACSQGDSAQASPCTAEQFIAYEVYRWRQNLSQSLLAGGYGVLTSLAVVVTGPTHAPNIQVALSWTRNRDKHLFREQIKAEAP